MSCRGCLRAVFLLVGLVLAVPLAVAQSTPEPGAEAEPSWLGDLIEGVRALLAGAAAPTAPVPAAALGSERTGETFDAFLTFVVKRAGAEAESLGLREDLLGVLLDGRHDVLSMLGELLGLAPQDEQLLRELFRSSWTRLRPLLEQLVRDLGAEQAGPYQALIDAAGALLADPEVAQQIALTAETLRQLALTLAPDTTVDPLAYDTALDPQLRELFGFGPPLEAPLDNPEFEIEARTRRSPPRFHPARILFPVAWAAEPSAVSPAAAAAAVKGEGLSALSRRLNGWVPSLEDLDAYLPLMRELLRGSAEHALAAKPLEAEFRPLFDHLVLATAWQESCWRQFVRRQGKLRAISSGVGSVGVMQVNTRVWRGFYEIDGLRKDAGYNARAGSEILRHYLRDYAIRKGEHLATGSFDDLARATYAIYNGGPSHMTRYRKPGTKPSLRSIDELFWAKYQAVKAGDELGVARCFAGGAAH